MSAKYPKPWDQSIAASFSSDEWITFFHHVYFTALSNYSTIWCFCLFVEMFGVFPLVLVEAHFSVVFVHFHLNWPFSTKYLLWAHNMFSISTSFGGFNTLFCWMYEDKVRIQNVLMHRKLLCFWHMLQWKSLVIASQWGANNSTLDAQENQPYNGTNRVFLRRKTKIISLRQAHMQKNHFNLTSYKNFGWNQTETAGHTWWVACFAFKVVERRA